MNETRMLVRWLPSVTLLLVATALHLGCPTATIPVEDDPTDDTIVGDSWTGTASHTFTQISDVTISITSITAQVTWTLESIDNNVAFYTPTGTASYVDSVCSYNPSSGTIVPSDGTLFVDYNANPPTYYGRGQSQWTTTINCPDSGGPQPYQAEALWLSTFSDESLSPDGMTMEGYTHTSTVPTIPFAEITQTWEFTRD